MSFEYEFIVIFALFSISIISLICTIIYLVRQRKMNTSLSTSTSIIITICSCHALLYVLALTNLTLILTIINEIISSFICQAIGVSFYFSYISLNTWLSIMAYDIWRTISSKTQILPQSYKKYSILAWSLVLIITTTVSIIDKTKLLDLRPMFGELNLEEKILPPNCIINNSNALIFYISLFKDLALVSNLILFVFMIWNIIEVRNDLETRKKLMKNRIFGR